MSDFDDPYSNLSDDPESAFLQLEEHFRRTCELKIKNAHNEHRIDIFYVDYIAEVLAAIYGTTASGRVPRSRSKDRGR